MPKTTTVPPGLRAFVFHGLDLEWSEGGPEAVGRCPFCRSESEKFYVNLETTKWNCRRGDCGVSGNAQSFLQQLHEASMPGDALPHEYAELAKDRGLLDPRTLVSWGVCLSRVTDEWLVPGYSASGVLRQLYRYTRVGDRMLLLPTPGFGHWLLGPREWVHDKARTVYVCEGPWDGMALWETMASARVVGGDSELNGDGGGGKLVPGTTADRGKSLLSTCAVLSAPSCNVFHEKWCPALSGKAAAFLFDSDYPRTDQKTGATQAPAGFAGVKRACEVLSVAEEPPSRVSYLKWGPVGYDPQRPDGYDVRDYLSEKGYNLSERVRALGEILSRLEPIPAEWLEGRSAEARKNGQVELTTKPCNRWVDLKSSWRLTFKWTAGLDRALSCMMAAVISTKVVGDQLWVKIVGPPSCISAQTHIRYVVRDKSGERVTKHGGPISRLFQRFHGLPQKHGGHRWRTDELEYTVPSVDEEGRVFHNNVKDVLYQGRKRVYRLTTLSGKTLEATADHEILTPAGFRRLEQLAVGDQVMTNPGKTAKKGRAKYKSYRPEIFVKYHPTALTKTVNGCTYHRITVYRAVYEAHKNGMDLASYRRLLNDPDAARTRDLWTIPPGWEIHHKDRDYRNNLVDNLELMESSSEHRLKYHMDQSNEGIAVYAVSDEVVAIRDCGCKDVYDIVCADPHRNFSAGGIIVHNCGKSVLCEALSVAKKYVKATSSIRGFHSGYKVDGDGSEDVSLLAQCRDKTLVVKDGDTLIQSPNLSLILAEARDIYDRVSRTHYRNKTARSYEGLNMSFVLCGTEGLRVIDRSELGERFVDCVVVHEMDSDTEEEIGWRVANRTHDERAFESNGKAEDQHEPHRVEAMRLTGGYVEYLRANAQKLLAAVKAPDWALRRCVRLGKFTSYMRCKQPSGKHEGTVQRELSFRLISQLVRLATCLAAVLNKREIDHEVMRRVTCVALDTSRGKLLDVTRALHGAGDVGLDIKALASVGQCSDVEARVLLRFMLRLGITEVFSPQLTKGYKSPPRWRLTRQLTRLYTEVSSYEVEGD